MEERAPEELAEQEVAIEATAVISEEPTPEKPELERSKRKTRVGKVVSDKGDKTIIVLIETTDTHPLYKKRIKKSKRFPAHDENNECRVGDTVRIMETRPLSKTKHWRLVEIVEKAK
jgi:small subunit ribosomal protein S17